MTLTLTPYAIPALITLLTKAGMFFYAGYSKIQNLRTRLYLLFLFCLSIQNLAEITFFIARAEGLMEPWGGKLYFGATIPAFAFLLHLALVTAASGRNNRSDIPQFVLTLIYGPVIVLEILLWGSSLIVSGFQRMAYTYTKIPGPLYFLFELQTISYLIIAMAVLAYGLRNQITPFRRLQSKFLLVGLTPVVVIVVSIIALQRFGFRGFNSTATFPVAVTFFLAVTAYATHQHRLFDIEFFIPWSKVRKRKTVFYQRIQAAIAEIASLRSVQEAMNRVANTLHCQVGLVGGVRPVLALVDGQQVKPELRISSFPRDSLEKVDRIVVANEIADSKPELYALMRQYRIDAIVPFTAHSGACGNWMLLGEHFSDNVYTPLDFKMVEGLFARIAELFVDDLLLVRAHLADAREEIQRYRDRLVSAWSQLEEERQRAAALEERVHRLREDAVRLRRQRLRLVAGDKLDNPDLPPEVVAGQMTMHEYLERCEARMIQAALRITDGDQPKAARLLGVYDTQMLRYMMEHGHPDAPDDVDTER